MPRESGASILSRIGENSGLPCAGREALGFRRRPARLISWLSLAASVAA